MVVPEGIEPSFPPCKRGVMPIIRKDYGTCDGTRTRFLCADNAIYRPLLLRKYLVNPVGVEPTLDGV